MQCAAVSTHCGGISVPRQLSPPVSVMKTLHGWLRSRSVVATGVAGASVSDPLGTVVIRFVVVVDDVAGVASPRAPTAVGRASAPDADDTSSSSSWSCDPQPTSCDTARAPNSSSEVNDLSDVVFISVVSLLVGLRIRDRATAGPTRKTAAFSAVVY